MLWLWRRYCGIFVSDTWEVLKLRKVSQLFFPHQESWEKFCYCPYSFSLSYIMWLDNLRGGLEAWAWALISVITEQCRWITWWSSGAVTGLRAQGQRFFFFCSSIVCRLVASFYQCRSFREMHDQSIEHFGIPSSGIYVGKPSCCCNRS